MSAGLKVLVADNSMTMRKFIMGLLCTDFTVDESQSVEVDNTLAAIEAAKTQTFDLITLDLYMLPQTGLFAARAIREMGIQTPLLLITSEVNPERLAEARAAGINEFVSKPIDPDVLRQTVESVLKIGAK